MTDGNKNNELFQLEDPTSTEEVLALLKRIAKSQDEAVARMDESDRKFNAMQSELMAAFPNGDLGGHKNYHEKLIQAADAQTKLWSDLRITVIKRGVLGAFYTILVLAVIGVYSAGATIYRQGGVSMLIQKLFF